MENKNTIVYIEPSQLVPHPKNAELFDNADDEAYKRLKDSIEMMGILTPLRIAPDMTIISGHQRWRAAMDLHLPVVPVIVDADTRDEGTVMMKLIVSNFGRAKNDPIKQAKMIQEYERLCGIRAGARTKAELEARKEANGGHVPFHTQEEIAAELGVTGATLRNLKRLLDIDPDLQQMISDGKITPTTGFKIIAKLSEEEQIQLVQRLDSTQRYTEAMIQQKVNEICATDLGLMHERDTALAERNNANRISKEAIKNAKESREKLHELEVKYNEQLATTAALQARFTALQSERDTMEERLQAEATPEVVIATMIQASTMVTTLEAMAQMYRDRAEDFSNTPNGCKEKLKSINQQLQTAFTSAMQAAWECLQGEHGNGVRKGVA